MTHTLLNQLPPPPPGKTGYPWTEETLSVTLNTAASDLPRISIITPSYNQGHFIEETIRSVLLQGYPNLEYIIIDGGSTDNTIEIIKKYEPWITYWVSERDRGQTHAINKGLARATGEIWSYLNSDDLLCLACLHQVTKSFENPKISWIGGISDIFDETEHRGFIAPMKPEDQREYLTPWNRQHQYLFPCSNVCFMRRQLLDLCGCFDESYHYGMDIEYYLRVIFQTNVKPYFISNLLGRWRWHSESKTLKQGIAYGFREDEVRMANQYLHYLDSDQQEIVRTEIKEQQHWLVARRAMFYRDQAMYKRAWAELLSEVTKNPSLLQFRPWFGAIRVLMNDALFG